MDNDTPVKQCSKCKQMFPATIEFFQTTYNRQNGLRADCRQCRKAAKHAWDEVHKSSPKYPENNEFQRKCKACQVVYPLTDDYFHKSVGAKYGFNYTCKECTISRAIKWYDDNLEHALEYNREYYQRNKSWIDVQNKEWAERNPEKSRAIKQAYIDRNPSRRKKQALDWRWRNHEQSLEYSKEWRRNNPEKSRSHHHIRKARILLAPGIFTQQDLAEMYEHQDGRCLYCGIAIYWKIPGDIHVEHVQPISRGGSNYPENLALSCPDCNLSKGVKTLDEWQKVRGW